MAMRMAGCVYPKKRTKKEEVREKTKKRERSEAGDRSSTKTFK